MRFLAIILLSVIMSANAFAITVCESTVVPLAFAMARANGQANLTKKLFIDVAADYSEILVTLANSDYSKESKFRMIMGEEYTTKRKCIVSGVEALR